MDIQMVMEVFREAREYTKNGKDPFLNGAAAMNYALYKAKAISHSDANIISEALTFQELFDFINEAKRNNHAEGPEAD